MKKLDAKSLSAIMSMEKNGKRERSAGLNEFLHDLPDDNPMKSIVMRVKEEASKNGRTFELSDLPDNHPLILRLAEAKQRFEERVSEKQLEPTPQVEGKTKKLKKIVATDKEKMRKEKEAKERIVNEKIAKINSTIKEQVGSLSSLFGELNELSLGVGDNFVLSNKIAKLKRLVLASRNGLNQSFMREWRGE